MYKVAADAGSKLLSILATASRRFAGRVSILIMSHKVIADVGKLPLRCCFCDLF